MTAKIDPRLLTRCSGAPSSLHPVVITLRRGASATSLGGVVAWTATLALLPEFVRGAIPGRDLAKVAGHPDVEEIILDITRDAVPE